VVEGCASGNGAIDPGETVTVNFTLKNIGNWQHHESACDFARDQW